MTAIEIVVDQFTLLRTFETQIYNFLLIKEGKSKKSTVRSLLLSPDVPKFWNTGTNYWCDVRVQIRL